MKTLLIMRHAKSSWKQPGMADHDRPLNQRGQNAAPRIGQLMSEQRLRPDLVLSSTAQRARATAELVVQCWSDQPRIELHSELYLAGPASYFEIVRSQPDHIDCLLVIGHNPGLEHLLEMLTGADAAMPTAALAVVEFDLESWSELDTETAGRLMRLYLPRELES